MDKAHDVQNIEEDLSIDGVIGIKHSFPIGTNQYK
jgi:hypothetical protein